MEEINFTYFGNRCKYAGGRSGRRGRMLSVKWWGDDVPCSGFSLNCPELINTILKQILLTIES